MKIAKTRIKGLNPPGAAASPARTQSQSLFSVGSSFRSESFKGERKTLMSGGGVFTGNGADANDDLYKRL